MKINNASAIWKRNLRNGFTKASWKKSCFPREKLFELSSIFGTTATSVLVQPTNDKLRGLRLGIVATKKLTILIRWPGVVVKCQTHSFSPG